MKVLKEGIEEYRQLVKRKYSIDISQAQAEQQFKELLALVRVIYKPIKRFDRNDFSKYNAKNEKK